MQNFLASYSMISEVQGSWKARQDREKFILRGASQPQHLCLHGTRTPWALQSRGAERGRSSWNSCCGDWASAPCRDQRGLTFPGRLTAKKGRHQHGTTNTVSTASLDCLLNSKEDIQKLLHQVLIAPVEKHGEIRNL